MVTDNPNLRQISLLRDTVKKWNQYPFNVPVIKNLTSLDIREKVCFFIGENRFGKSTLLEALAGNYGFGKEGGSRNISFTTVEEDKNDLADYLRLSWSTKLLGGYFFRAESFFNIASHIDELQKIDGGAYAAYGGESLHSKSHGQSFLALFNNRFSHGGFFLLDEPEAALSPKRQLSLLAIIHQMLQEHPQTQFIIATHSPIILTYPDAQIFSFNEKTITETTYEETEIYQLTKSFLNNPKTYLEKLFAD